MKTLTLDLKKWRCGGDEGENKLGKGETLLLNIEGFMCCLGQFSRQLGVPEDTLLMYATPEDLGEDAPKEFIDADAENNELAYTAIGINDDKSLTTEERISQLKQLFSKHGFEIKVIE